MDTSYVKHALYAGGKGCENFLSTSDGDLDPSFILVSVRITTNRYLSLKLAP